MGAGRDCLTMAPVSDVGAMPLVSIVIPNFNHGHYIGGAIEAIARQSYPNKEIIVVDDGSTDDSVEVIKTKQKDYPFVRLFQPGKIGGNRAANLGFSHVNGKFVVFSAADDLIQPGLLERAIQLLMRHPRAPICFADATALDVGSGRTWNITWGQFKEETFLTPEQFVEGMKRRMFWILGASSVWRTDAFRRTGGWPTELEWMADWFLSLAAAFRLGVCYIPEALALVRQEPQTYSRASQRDNTRRERAFDNLIQALDSPKYADVADKFRETGALWILGSAFLLHLLRRGLRLRLVGLRVYRLFAGAAARRIKTRFCARLPKAG